MSNHQPFTEKATYIGSVIGTALGWTLNEWLSVLSFVVLLTFYAVSIFYKFREDRRAQEAHNLNVKKVSDE